MLERIAKELNIETYQLLLPKDISKEDVISAEYKKELLCLKDQIDKLFDKKIDG